MVATAIVAATTALASTGTAARTAPAILIPTMTGESEACQCSCTFAGSTCSARGDVCLCYIDASAQCVCEAQALVNGVAR
ncbi:MAG: hypothetical protein ACYDCK_09750 [Thermoplasmatota archaeon]